jgi:hypothetical protein
MFRLSLSLSLPQQLQSIRIDFMLHPIAYTRAGPGAVKPRKEPHFGTSYWKDPLPKELITLWATVKPASDLVCQCHIRDNDSNLFFAFLIVFFIKTVLIVLTPPLISFHILSRSVLACPPR